jgi:hypothetical protein
MARFILMWGFTPSILMTDNKEQNLDDEIKQKTDSELKDIVINRNLYSGKMISAARKELENRRISLTESERQLMEANKRARIEDAKKNAYKKSDNNWLKRLFSK